MAQYFFFDIIAGGQLSLDEEGMTLPNMEAARREATRSLADLARDINRTEYPPGLTISVRNCEGPVLETAFQWITETRH
jgi:hypothetical protein